LSEVLLDLPRGRSERGGRRPCVIMIFAPKGGVGKSTLASNLLVAAATAGHDAVGLDFDGQRALRLWGVDRDETMQKAPWTKIVPVEVREAHITDWRDELHLVRRRGVVVIDTPPGVERQSQKSLRELGHQADMILMPTEFFGGSMRFVVDFMAWFADKPGRAIFVLNKTMPSTTLNADSRDTLAEYGEVWPDSIPLRVDLARAFERGLAAADSPSIPCGKQFADLWSLCLDRIGSRP
jgi:chromosome partitioning protein